MSSSAPDVLPGLADTVSGLIAVYQFGSTTQGGEHADSDLDLVQAIVEEHLSDFTQFTELVVTTNGFRTNS